MMTTNTFHEATAAQVHLWLTAGECTLIDVREADEHARERIMHAQLNPLSRFDAACVQTHPNTKRFVFHCKGGRRSADASARACAIAKPDVEIFSMAGGIDAWKNASLPVQTNHAAPRMSVMQQTQLVIGLATLIGAALAYFVHPAFVAIPAFFGAGLAFAGATGTCGLAIVLAKMPWNRVVAANCASGSCTPQR